MSGIEVHRWSDPVGCHRALPPRLCSKPGNGGCYQDRNSCVNPEVVSDSSAQVKALVYTIVLMSTVDKPDHIVYDYGALAVKCWLLCVRSNIKTLGALLSYPTMDLNMHRLRCVLQRTENVSHRSWRFCVFGVQYRRILFIECLYFKFLYQT